MTNSQSAKPMKRWQWVIVTVVSVAVGIGIMAVLNHFL